MIGIISRKDSSTSGKDIYVLYKAINDKIIEHNEIGIGILPNYLKNVKEVLKICDGVILEGGNDFTLLDLDIIKYLYDNDIPTLGICLGMQSMSYYFNGKIGHLLTGNHNSSDYYVHDVNIKNSNVYPDGQIKVNSRHKDYVINTSLECTGQSNDNIIEMVEDKTKIFFVGVEWHPENIDDDNSKMLFNKFFSATRMFDNLHKI